MPIGIRSDANAGVTASAGPFGLCGALMSRTGCPPQLARWLLWGTISLQRKVDVLLSRAPHYRDCGRLSSRVHVLDWSHARCQGVKLHF